MVLCHVWFYIFLSYFHCFTRTGSAESGVGPFVVVTSVDTHTCSESDGGKFGNTSMDNTEPAAGRDVRIILIHRRLPVRYLNIAKSTHILVI